MTPGKLFVIATWVAAIGVWWLAGGWLQLLDQITFGLLVVTHPIEFLVKRELFARLGGSMGRHFAQTLVFGLFYWRPLERQLAADATPSGS